MNILVVYDSKFGNTRLVAESIADELRNIGETKIMTPLEVTATELASVDLLIVGSPTQGGQPTNDAGVFVAGLPMAAVNKDLAVAVFDTRLAEKEHGFGLGLLMKTIGFAAPKMAKALKYKGIETVVDPEGFIVEDKEGPLKTGELERSRRWSKEIVNALSSQMPQSA